MEMGREPALIKPSNPTLSSSLMFRALTTYQPAGAKEVGYCDVGGGGGGLRNLMMFSFSQVWEGVGQ